MALQKIKNRMQSGKVLLATSVLSEDGYISEYEEYKVYMLVVDILYHSNYKIYIKQHPRELKRKINHNSVKYLPNNIIFEDINYAEYDYIINFKSSIVIDAVLNGYPSNRIITIGKVKSKNEPFFSQTIQIEDYKNFRIEKNHE